MHEVTSSHWHEPEGTKNAGYEYEQILKDGGVPSQMDPSLYVDPLKT
jgi:hypothetical protein